MYIKSIVLDGFKSYGKRTEIVGFDQLFNAITGLNGSGKSNILDAICFVLGLSNMSLARCTTLRELIFKNGQAGVHKAIVTITFDNADKSQSPTGYEDLSEIVIRREVHLNSRTKYYVCGQSVTNSQVSDLFHSVQLNISNPHFLIMQGRITKVLNMKPHDILAMIEEATGVSMYEVKKKSTQGMIEKKDQALKSIDLLISETIMPKLEQLRKEHANFLDFQNLLGELEKLNRQYIAWQFYQNQRKADHASGKTENCERKIQDFRDLIKEIDVKQKEITSRISAIEQENDELSGCNIKELEEELKDREKVEIKESGKLEKLVDAVNEEKKKRSSIESQLKKDGDLVEKKRTEYEKIQQDFKGFEEKFIAAENELARCERNYDAITSGKALNEEGEASGSLADQLRKAEEELNAAKTEMEIIETVKLVNSKRELVTRRAEANQHKVQYEGDQKNMSKLTENIDNLKQRIETVNYDDQQYLGLLEEKGHLECRLAEIDNWLRDEERKIRVDFQYGNIPGFNSKCVHGPICKLFTLRDQKYAKAVETAAGGRLYEIAIDTNDQCREILDKGTLSRGYNLIALNKIRGKPIDRHAVEAAKNIAKDENIVAAGELVEYERFLKSAMEYVFGDTIVAPDVEKATKITYSNLRKRTVTLDGDVINPGGDMKGGAVSNRDCILSALCRLKAKAEERKKLVARLQDIQDTLKQMEVTRKEFMSLTGELKRQVRELDSIKVQTSSYHKLFDAVNQLEQDISKLEDTLVTLRDTYTKSGKRAEELRTKLSTKGLSNDKKELEMAKKALATSKKDVESQKKFINERKAELVNLNSDIDILAKSCENCIEEIKTMENLIQERQAEVDGQLEVVEEAKEKVKQIADQLKDQRAKLREQNGEINKLTKKRDKMVVEIKEKELEIKKIQHEVEQISAEAKDASHAVKSMMHKHKWISDECHMFGKENSDYPFNSSSFDIKDLSARLQKLQATKANMQKTVNQRANLLLTDKEKEADGLKNKRAVIENDRDKLISYMEEVDRKKKEALYKAWRKINVDFDSIFSTFLPNTHAKLDLVPGKDLLFGLEVKVAFGDVWKESLTELSGGQRSLVALSLILALLKYNPAPLYILDEVDAALDQNHTQNTGTMIKKHFNKSQFVIVSLKDDMFRNANVLFKTKFVDGKSTVMRYTHTIK